MELLDRVEVRESDSGIFLVRETLVGEEPSVLLDLLRLALYLLHEICELALERCFYRGKIGCLAAVQRGLAQRKAPFPSAELDLELVNLVFKASDEHHVPDLDVGANRADERVQKLDLVGDVLLQRIVTQLQARVFLAESDFIHGFVPFLVTCFLKRLGYLQSRSAFNRRRFSFCASFAGFSISTGSSVLCPFPTGNAYPFNLDPLSHAATIW